MNLATTWVLKIQLQGEWEECAFGTRQEALTAFMALAEDYTADIQRAVLHPNPLPGTFEIPSKKLVRSQEYIN